MSVTSSRADPTGKGVYTWENGARLDGSFKEGKAHGPGVYVSAKGGATKDNSSTASWKD